MYTEYRYVIRIEMRDKDSSGKDIDMANVKRWARGKTYTTHTNEKREVLPKRKSFPENVRNACGVLAWEFHQIRNFYEKKWSILSSTDQFRSQMGGKDGPKRWWRRRLWYKQNPSHSIHTYSRTGKVNLNAYVCVSECVCVCERSNGKCGEKHHRYFVFMCVFECASAGIRISCHIGLSHHRYQQMHIQ